MPTWFTGALLAVWMTRSATVPAAEDPEVAGPGRLDGLLERDGARPVRAMATVCRRRRG